MSNGGSSQRRPKISTGTASVRLIAVSLASAAAIFGGLAVQMAHGHDPALGAGTSTAQTGTPAQTSTPAQTGDSAGGSDFQDQSGSTSSGQSFQDQSGSSSSGVVTRAS